VWPSLVAITALAAAIAFGVSRDRSPATLNNVMLAATHFVILSAGVAPALRRRRELTTRTLDGRASEAAA
jgi:hypothetical protein